MNTCNCISEKEAIILAKYYKDYKVYVSNARIGNCARCLEELRRVWDEVYKGESTS